MIFIEPHDLEKCKTYDISVLEMKRPLFLPSFVLVNSKLRQRYTETCLQIFIKCRSFYFLYIVIVGTVICVGACGGAVG